MAKKEKQTIRLYHKQLVKEIFPNDIKPKFKIGQVVEVKKSSKDIIHNKVSWDYSGKEIDKSYDWAIFNDERERLIGKKGTITEIDFIADENSKDLSGLISYMVKFGRWAISLCEEWLKCTK